MVRPHASEYPYFAPRFIPLAHRGGALLPANRGLENTLFAFDQAYRLGFRWMETDLHATADGHLVAFHDPHLLRVCGVDAAIADLTLAQVRDIAWAPDGRIPTLVDLLETFPEAYFNLDLKSDGLEQKLWDVLRETRAEHRVCVGSFDTARIARFRRIAGPTVATAASAPAVAWTRFVPFISPPADQGVALQIPPSHTWGEITFDVIVPSLIRRVHRAGKVVHAWTIDDAPTMHRLLDIGVDGIVSDRPDVLREVCLTRGIWPHA